MNYFAHNVIWEGGLLQITAEQQSGKMRSDRKAGIVEFPHAKRKKNVSIDIHQCLVLFVFNLLYWSAPKNFDELVSCIDSMQ